MSSRAEPESERAISTIWRSPTRRVPTMAVRVDVDLELVEDACGRAGRIARQDDEAVAVGDASERDVLRDGQRRRVLELLEDDGHAQVACLARREHG